MSENDRSRRATLLKRALNSPISWAVIGLGGVGLLAFPGWLTLALFLGVESATIVLLSRSRSLQQKLIAEEHQEEARTLKQQWKRLRSVLPPEEWQRYHRLWSIQEELRESVERQRDAFLRRSLQPIVERVQRLTRQAGSLMRTRCEVTRALTQMNAADLQRRLQHLEQQLRQTSDDQVARGYRIALAATREGLASVNRLQRALEQLDAHLHAIESGLAAIKLRVLLIQSKELTSHSDYDPIGNALTQLIDEADVIEEVLRETSQDIIDAPLLRLNGELGESGEPPGA
jgi:hypothetical protein